MPTIPRIAYFAQTAKVSRLNPDFSVIDTTILPVNSANIEVTRPIEAVTAFGKFKSLNTAQTNITTCKSSLKCYLGAGEGGVGNVDSGFINNIVKSTQEGYLKVEVAPGGFSMIGIVSNIGIDISLGGFAMLDLGFAGVGNPSITDAGTSQTTVVLDDAAKLSPVTTLSIGSAGGLANTFATSIKFAYDLPTDTLGALGENPNANQESMKSIIATKAPYKSSITVEGYGIDITQTKLDSSIANALFSIGNIGISLPNAKISARSFNNAAGQVSATFSYTIEDVGANFETITVNAYNQGFGQTDPMYGG